MANHGISTVGATVAEAYDRLYYIERAAQVQIYAMWTGPAAQTAARCRGRKDQARAIGGDTLYNPPPARPSGISMRSNLILDRKEPDYAS